MPLAIEIISSCANVPPSRVADVLVGYELATGLCLGADVSWDALPLGAGSQLIDFLKSDYANPELLGTYGEIARAWLHWRLSKFA